MEKKPKDIDDFFESSVLLSETQYHEGFKGGYNDGLISGEKEGREVGLKMGFQAGEELGFCQGCVDVWNAVIRIDSQAFSHRRTWSNLGSWSVDTHSRIPENVQLQEIMENIRTRFRIISANFGVRLDYEGRPTSSIKEVEDL